MESARFLEPPQNDSPMAIIRPIIRYESVILP
jgi:hypothetical protein